MTSTLLNNRYRLIRTLGSGGFGNTFLAEDSYLPSKRNCVIKQLKPVTLNPEVQQLVQDRFAKEAAILEKLGEGNNQIPKLFAYFQENDQYYLVQEWIDGETLTNLIYSQGSFSESFVTQILLDILPVLSYIHSNNIVHRDLKPDNIILRSRDNKPVLIDFGAVKETMGTILNSQGGTSTSIVIGTPGFMPSEQMTGRPVYSSDLYALGLVAIYLLTGKKPLDLQTDYNTGEIIWQSYCPNISLNLKNVITKAVMSHARDRFSTAQMMLAALQSGSETIAPTFLPTTAVSHKSEEIAEVKPKQNPLIISSIIIGLITGISVIIGLFLMQNVPSQVNHNSSPSPSSINQVNRTSPEQALRNYYETINQGNYQEAWNLLSSEFRDNQKLHPEGFNSYLSWWKTVKFVEIIETEGYPISENSDQGSVAIKLKYHLQDGRPQEEQTLVFNLIWDQNSNQWLIDKVLR